MSVGNLGRNVSVLLKGLAAAQDKLTADDSDVSAETGRWQWRGERLDLHMAMDGLLQSDARSSAPDAVWD